MNKGAGEVVAFPIHRRVDLLRQTVKELAALNGDSANDYWRTLARRLLSELLEQGRDMDAARGDVLRFFEVVQSEFRSQLLQQRSMAPA